MKVFDVEVRIGDRKNSYIKLPQKLTRLFVQNGQDAILLFLPFRHSALIKSLGISKEDFDKYFEKSGMSCSLITMRQFEQLVRNIKKLYPVKSDREDMLRYFGSHASQSSTGKFSVPFTARSNFVGGTFKIIVIYDDESGMVRSEIMEEENLEKINKIARKLAPRLSAPKQSKGKTK